jgi:hypothetical protein
MEKPGLESPGFLFVGLNYKKALLTEVSRAYKL